MANSKATGAVGVLPGCSKQVQLINDNVLP
jgi:hypothetical protein